MVMIVNSSPFSSFAASTSLIQQDLTLIDVLKDIPLPGPAEKIFIDPNDIIQDSIVYYKNPDFDASKKLRVSFIGQPGVDSGGLSRQYFTDAIEAVASCESYMLFEGTANRKLPSYNSTSVHSGLFKVLGRMIGHAIIQSHIGYPCLAPSVYWYIAMFTRPYHMLVLMMSEMKRLGSTLQR